MNWPFGALQMFGHDVVVADVPSEFELYGAASDKAAAGQYHCMSDEELCHLRVGELVRQHALLLYWTNGPMIASGRAQRIVRAWGAVPKTELVWIKVTKNGKARMGTGYRARSMHESIILATWGNPKHKPFPSSFAGVARRHSEKPVEFYSLVVEHTPGADRCDLFSAGIERPGFAGWGEDHRITTNGATHEHATGRKSPTAQQSSFFGEEVRPLRHPDRRQAKERP